MAMRLRSTTLILGRKRIPNGFRFRFRPHNGIPNGQLTKKRMAFSSSSSKSPPPPFFGKLWESYTKALIARPLLVKGGAASLIFLASDAATQKLMMDADDADDDSAFWASFDASRALSGAGFGVVATCWLHYWWGFLEIVVNKRLPVGAYGQNKMVNALGKVVADQLVGAPLYIYFYYCVTHFGKEYMKPTTSTSVVSNSNSSSSPSSSEGDDKEQEKAATSTSDSDHGVHVVTLAKETSDRALEMLPDTLLRHWTLWPIVHTLNFYYNPLHHRVLVQNVVLIFWSGYLSHLNNGGLDVVTPEKEIELVAAEHKRRDSIKTTTGAPTNAASNNTSTAVVATSTSTSERAC